MTTTRHHKVRIGDWTEGDDRYRFVVEVRVDVSRPGPTWQTVEHGEITDPLRLSVTGEALRRTSSGRWTAASSGQCSEDLDRVADFATGKGAGLGWDAERRDTLAALWRDWHLNDMRAGCAHQTIVREDGPYGSRPSLTLTKPCPETGYRYGSAWLVEPLTDEAYRTLDRLFGPA